MARRHTITGRSIGKGGAWRVTGLNMESISKRAGAPKFPTWKLEHKNLGKPTARIMLIPMSGDARPEGSGGYLVLHPKRIGPRTVDNLLAMSYKDPKGRTRFFVDERLRGRGLLGVKGVIAMTFEDFHQRRREHGEFARLY